MLHLFKPAEHKPQLPAERIDPEYKKLRLQVFLGIFIGYAAYYFVRKNFSFSIKDLQDNLGYTKAQLGFAMSALSIAYGLSKFFMGNVSDRSNARYFLATGLILSSLTMIFMGFFSFATSSVAVMFGLLFINGWVQGMGWPASGRVVVHWYSIKERGTAMSIWNLAHNVGGFLVGPLTIWGVELFADWQARLYFPGMIAILVAFVSILLVRDTPQSCGLPPIEEYNNDYPKTYDASQEKEFTAKEIFLKYVLNNKMLWFIAIANAFVYLVRNGIINWAPTFLQEAKHFSASEAAWSASFYELAAIPGTILCGVLSDKVFKGRRAPVTIIYMALTFLAAFVYWQAPGENVWVINIALWSIGFLIYGPVMLIGVQALDLVPKKAAGTAAGLTGLFGYFIGDLLANAALGSIVDKSGWSASFELILGACILAIVFTAMTWNKEKDFLRLK
ncbi:glycerol-3-phosphate transporter [Sphingobacterium psychroaquaticum]|uniref:Glycerol-3-phosphate transporter n=1 Tax=Sphingobacterium psychroaquaticum TaxID=561061 RepID=A0A1X7I3W4_9SPHI|nr:glycerol-3-phosphate transporter [Sphingobacterium psychroaquaticum]QBQ41977.1 glycerol-3-phosphate transporter [Sphingobacterium psychroaquaticum]SMG08642.1 MFS transporter, OPA family, glycerol-3-phosphate transporter [Sphingobacterium psychroaquaticum]